MKIFFPLTTALVAAACIVSNATADNARADSPTFGGTASSASADNRGNTGLKPGEATSGSAAASANKPTGTHTPVARTNRTGSNPMNTPDRTTNTAPVRR